MTVAPDSVKRSLYIQRLDFSGGFNVFPVLLLTTCVACAPSGDRNKHLQDMKETAVDHMTGESPGTEEVSEKPDAAQSGSEFPVWTSLVTSCGTAPALWECGDEFMEGPGECWWKQTCEESGLDLGDLSRCRMRCYSRFETAAVHPHVAECYFDYSTTADCRQTAKDVLTCDLNAEDGHHRIEYSAMIQCLTMEDDLYVCYGQPGYRTGWNEYCIVRGELNADGRYCLSTVVECCKLRRDRTSTCDHDPMPPIPIPQEPNSDGDG